MNFAANTKSISQKKKENGYLMPSAGAYLH